LHDGGNHNGGSADARKTAAETIESNADSPCPVEDAADLLTASIDYLVAKRQPFLDALADAEKKPGSEPG
jgi:hypothetical protein